MKTIWVTISIMLLFSIWTVQATEIPTNVSIDNDPFVTTITLVDADGGNLQVWENDTRIFNCSGTVEDLDGFADIVNVNATLFGPTSTENAANSFGLHYRNSSCSIFGSSGNTSNFKCEFVVHHHTKPGNWTCNASVNDTFTRFTTNVSNNTVDDFKSIQVDNQTIQFGTYAHGQTSGTTDKTVSINNSGNVAFNITIDAYSLTGVPGDINAMVCTVGSLPVGSIVFEYLPGITAASKIPLANAPTLVQANVTHTAYGSAAFVAYSFYLGIIIPASGQGGVCNGFLDVTAT